MAPLIFFQWFSFLRRDRGLYAALTDTLYSQTLEINSILGNFGINLE